MAIKTAVPIKAEQTNDKALERTQAHAAEQTTIINAAPHLFGRLLGPVRIANAGDKVSFAHGLGRIPRGSRVERLQAAAGVYPSIIEVAADQGVITFQASQPCWALFWVW